MIVVMKKRFNTGKGLPRATMGDQFELWEFRDKLVKQPIMRQSRRDGTVLYGANAVNALVGPDFSRNTYDYDVYSRMPLSHARELERHIDRGVNADLMYVEQTSYPSDGKEKRLFRVKNCLNDVVEADYNGMPDDIQFVKRGGVRYETLGRASKKYDKMIRQPELGRGFHGLIDEGRIRSFRFFKKIRR